MNIMKILIAELAIVFVILGLFAFSYFLYNEADVLTEIIIITGMIWIAQVIAYIDNHIIERY